MTDTFKLVSGGDDIKLWEPPNLRLLQTFKPHSQVVSSLAWSPNNNFLASTAAGDQVVVTSFKGATPSSVELSGCEDDTCLSFNSTSRHLLTAGKSNVLNLWDLKTRTIKKKIKVSKNKINCVTFNWNDTTIASGTTEGDILLHSLSTTQTSSLLRLPKTQTIHALHFSRFKKSLLGSVSDDGAMNIWDTNSKRIVSNFPDRHCAPAMDICFSPMNDMLLASVGLDKKIIFYDVVGKKVIKEMSTESPLTSLSFMQDGAAFAVGSTRGKMEVFDLRSGTTPLHSVMAHKSAIRCLSFQLRPKGHSSTSSTLAEKFSSRSSSDSSRPKPSGPPLPERPLGHDMTTRAVAEPLQNGLKHANEESGIFSPLRDGLGPGNNDGFLKETTQKEQSQTYTGSSKRMDTVSDIFSPVDKSSISYQPPTITRDLNGYHATGTAQTKDDLRRVTRQPPMVATSIPHLDRPRLSSASEQLTGTVNKDKNKPVSTAPSNRDQEFVFASNRGKPGESSSQMQVESRDRGLAEGNFTSYVSTGASDMKSLSNTAGTREALNGFVQPPAVKRSVESAAGFQQFQVQFMKNLIDDSLDEFRINFHRDIVNLQVEMLRQFQIQQNEIKALLQQYSLNDALVQENEKLREEIQRLKSTH